MSLKLFEIPLEFVALQEALEASFGELTPEIEARMAELVQAAPEKVEAAAAVVRHLEAQADACKTEVDRMALRQAAFTRAADALRERMTPAVEALGKVKTSRFTIFPTVRSSYTYTLAPDHELYELPARFWRQKDPELNKTELKKAVEAGEAMPEFLHVEKTTTTSITIR